MPPSPEHSTETGAIAALLGAAPYSLPQAVKTPLMLQALWQRTLQHAEHGGVYRDILRRIDAAAEPPRQIQDLPFLPVRLFKSLRLQSVPDEQVVKILTSSGTTSQRPSQIAVDRVTAALQVRALAAIVTAFIGTKRLPMVIVDAPSTVRQRGGMNARGAGLLGLATFGRDHFYALDEDMRLDLGGLKAYAQRHRGEPVLVFGFTFMVWKHLCEALRAANERVSLNGGILIHGGGWKKLQHEAVDPEVFRDSLAQRCGIARVHDYYGMVEQVGSIFMECEAGYLHAPNVADVIVRDHRDWSPLPVGAPGLVQALSILPGSYPGHSLLTEDLGTIHGVDDCPCGRLGTRFKVHGRAPNSELRGCSDTYAFGSAATPAQGGGVRQFLPVERRCERIEEICSPVFQSQAPLEAFSPQVIDFLDAVSGALFRSADARRRPEIAALAFWLRRSSITATIDRFKRGLGPGELSQPLGIAFHVAPSNVDTIFLYSWALGMVAGNLNIVRLPKAMSGELALLVKVLAHTMQDPRWAPVADRNVVLTYDHDDRTSGYISQIADARLVWGGDETVKHLRRFPAKPTTREVGFAAKTSSCVLNAQRVGAMGSDEFNAIAHAFFDDAYQFDQLACSSPHFVFFVGTSDACERASERFWRSVQDEARRRGHGTAMATAVGRLTQAYELCGRGLAQHWTWGRRSDEAVVVRVAAPAIAETRARMGGGFFVECFVDDLSCVGAVQARTDQTLTYAGYDRAEIMAAAHGLTLSGIDRIVPIGRALEFGAVWDGFDLLGELTRRISVS